MILFVVLIDIDLLTASYIDLKQAYIEPSCSLHFLVQVIRESGRSRLHIHVYIIIGTKEEQMHANARP